MKAIFVEKPRYFAKYSYKEKDYSIEQNRHKLINHLLNKESFSELKFKSGLDFSLVKMKEISTDPKFNISEAIRTVDIGINYIRVTSLDGSSFPDQCYTYFCLCNNIRSNIDVKSLGCFAEYFFMVENIEDLLEKTLVSDLSKKLDFLKKDRDSITISESFKNTANDTSYRLIIKASKEPIYEGGNFNIALDIIKYNNIQLDKVVKEISLILKNIDSYLRNLGLEFNYEEYLSE